MSAALAALTTLAGAALMAPSLLWLEDKLEQHDYRRHFND